jgi:cytochrome c oxidase cbb3-type subunit 3
MSTDSKETKNTSEAPKLSGHSYDGIEELDNALPKWWINLFYLTIVFAGAYFLYYGIGEGPTLVQEYERHKNESELAALAKAGSIKTLTEPELRAFLRNPEKLKLGKEVFQSKCVSCHGSHGQGGIGPNLTDDYWIHGGKMTEIVQVITQGVGDKGMPPWGPLLSQDEIHAVASYIKSIRGTNPPNPKAPQGVLVKE